MFSKEPRCIYKRNPLINVICQLRFPVIREIGGECPKEFAEEIADVFPAYSLIKEPSIPMITAIPNYNHQFSSADGVWHLNLNQRFLSLSCSRYTCWESFAEHLDKPLYTLLSLYHPVIFERVGLRYINGISKEAFGLEKYSYSELIAPQYLGILGEKDIGSDLPTRSSVDAELAIGGGCKLKLHAGLGLIKKNGTGEQELRFVLDEDLFMAGKIPVAYSAGALEDLHSQAYGIFRGGITQVLHEAMEPGKG